MWVGEFCYSAKERRAILAALPNHGNAATLRTITALAREFLARRNHEQERPKPGVVPAQLKDLAGALVQVQRALAGLNQQTVYAVGVAAAAYDHTAGATLAQTSFATLCRELAATAHQAQIRVQLAQQAHVPQRHRPRTEGPRYAFVAGLYQLWIRAGNTPPRRSHNWQTGQDYSAFHTFAAACLRPLGATDGLDRVLREGLTFMDGTPRK